MDIFSKDKPFEGIDFLRTSLKSLFYELLKQSYDKKWDEKELLRQVFSEVAKLVEADEWSFLVVPPTGDWFFYVWSEYYDKLPLDAIAKEIQKSQLRKNHILAVISREKFWALKVSKSEDWVYKDSPIFVWLGVRIVSGENIRGVLNLDYFREIEITPELISIGEVLSNELSDFLRVFTKLFEIVSESEVDVLTGVFSRNKLRWDSKYLLQEGGFLIFLDLSHFKRVNDQYGHIIGDEVLNIVAKRLLGVVREKTDKVFRYGGDEFIVIVPKNCNVDKVVHKIKDVLSGPIKLSNGDIISLTVSAGVAEIQSDKTMREIIEEADKRMYEDKKAEQN